MILKSRHFKLSDLLLLKQKSNRHLNLQSQKKRKRKKRELHQRHQDQHLQHLQVKRLFLDMKRQNLKRKSHQWINRRKYLHSKTHRWNNLKFRHKLDQFNRKSQRTNEKRKPRRIVNNRIRLNMITRIHHSFKINYWIWLMVFTRKNLNTNNYLNSYNLKCHIKICQTSSFLLKSQRQLMMINKNTMWSMKAKSRSTKW